MNRGSTSHPLHVVENVHDQLSPTVFWGDGVKCQRVRVIAMICQKNQVSSELVLACKRFIFQIKTKR